MGFFKPPPKTTTTIKTYAGKGPLSPAQKKKATRKALPMTAKAIDVEQAAQATQEKKEIPRLTRGPLKQPKTPRGIGSKGFSKRITEAKPPPRAHEPHQDAVVDIVTEDISKLPLVHPPEQEIVISAKGPDGQTITTTIDPRLLKIDTPRAFGSKDFSKRITDQHRFREWREEEKLKREKEDEASTLPLAPITPPIATPLKTQPLVHGTTTTSPQAKARREVKVKTLKNQSIAKVRKTRKRKRKEPPGPEELLYL